MGKYIKPPLGSDQPQNIHTVTEQLFEFARSLRAQIDFNELLRIITSQITAILKADIISLTMINPQTADTVRTLIREGQSIEEKSIHLVQSNIVGWMLKHNEYFLSADITKDDRFRDKVFKSFDPYSAAVVPLIIEANIIGYLFSLKKKGTNPLNQIDLDILKKLSLLISPYLSNTQKLNQIFPQAVSTSDLREKYQTCGLIGKSARFIEMLKGLEAAAACDVRVLLEGKSGTGKERVAQAIHCLSRRKDKSFIAVDCGAIPTNLIESELFGHKKGSYTGAAADRKGMIEEAHNGTFFLDEVNNLPVNIQAKLLRVLQEGEVRPVGSNHPVKVDVRFITASSVPLSELVQNNGFRQDLFFRLYVYPIKVPTLNEREDDIPLLANHYLKKYARQQGKLAENISHALILFLKRRQWDGNIRELQNMMERLVTLADAETNTLDCNLLPADYQKNFRLLVDADETYEIHKSLSEHLDEYEEEIIRHALKIHTGNLTQTSRYLKISLSNLRYKLERLRINS